jgi:hypothetical protein
MPVGTLAGEMRERNEDLLTRANSILQELQTIQSAQVRIIVYESPFVWAVGLT